MKTVRVVKTFNTVHTYSSSSLTEDKKAGEYENESKHNNKWSENLNTES